MSDRSNEYRDTDPQETQEWLEAIDVVVEREGTERAKFLIKKTIDKATAAGTEPPDCSRTPYLNSIPVSREPALPGNPDVERRLRDIIRWNAMAMVVRANRKPASPGGHIASFQSSAVLYETRFNPV